jgi:hypothetical protein
LIANISGRLKLYLMMFSVPRKFTHYQIVISLCKKNTYIK